MRFLRLTRADVAVVLLILAYVIVLVCLPHALPAEEVVRLFSEEGWFERLSIPAWLFAALIIVLRIRPLTPSAWAFVWLFLMFAAREADLHKAFTADGILKINYYRQVAAPLTEKLIAAVVAIGFIALILYAGLVILRFLVLHRGWRSRAGLWLLLGTAGVVLGKVVDRAPAVLAEDFGVILSPMAELYGDALEEGLEMIHPLIMAWSIWISQDEGRYLT